MKVSNSLLISSILSFFILSCSVEDDPNSVACTDIFIVHTLTVLEPDGEPADSVEIDVLNKRTREPYDLCGDIYCQDSIEKGVYVIFHDGFLGEISKEREEAIVEGSKGSLSFSEEFAFFDDACHIRKIAGPDTVFLGTN